MIKIDEIITVENLKGFLKTLGYDWSGMYYHPYMLNNGLEDKPKTLENINDLFNDEFTFFVELYPTLNEDGSKNGPTIYVKIDIDYFILCEEEQRTDRKNPISDAKNYSKKWIMYLIENCGRKYVATITDKLKQEVYESIRLNQAKNMFLKKQINDNNKKLKRKIKDIENLMEEVNNKFANENEELNK